MITGATLIDGTGAPPRPETTIIVRDGRIAAVTPDGAARTAGAATVIDAAGKYVVPGFADMHVHFGSGGLEPAEATTTARILRQFLFYGVTTVFSVGGGRGNASSIRALRSRETSDGSTSPQIYATGSMLTLPGSHPVGTIMSVPDGIDPEAYDWTTRGVAIVATIEEARAEVRGNAQAGMDGIKIIVESGPTGFGDDHPQMSPEMISAVVDESSSLGLPVVAHVSSLDELEDAVESGVRAIMHAANEPYPGWEHWAEMRERNVFYVPTLSLFAPMLSDRWARPGALGDPFLRAGVPAHTQTSMERWESPMASVPALVRTGLWDEGLASIGSAHEAGVPIALGTDTGNPFVFPGYSVHVEFELLVEAGLTPMDALVAATRRPAEMLEKGDEFGTVEPGKRADLLILGADPLENIRNTRSLEVVIHAGHVVDRDALLLVPGHALAQPPPPILDMHLHARDAPDPEREPPPKLCLPVTVYGIVDPQCAEPLVAPATDEAMVERTVEILERRNVIGVISDDSLKTLARFRAAAPDRLIPAYELHLDGDSLSPEELRRQFEAGNLQVLGEIGIQYEGIAPDDERMEPYWALAEELDIPVALHLGEGYPGAPYLGSPDYRVRLGSPLLLEEVLVRHPDLRLYVMHYGSPLVDEMIAVMQTYPNVYIDIGGNTWPYPREFFYSQLKKFVDAGFGKRILFGSDQMLWPELIEISIEIIEEAPFLSEEQKRDIFYNNAARFLRLSEAEIARHHGRDPLIQGVQPEN